jgi:adenosylhomocysteine nucleosidase
MLGFIVALESETPNLLESLTNVQKHKINGFNVYTFNVLKAYVTIVYSGVGKANAAAATQLLIDHFKIKTVINIGTCGGISKKINAGDIVVPQTLSYYDVDVTAFGYTLQQIPHMPTEYMVDQALFNKIESIIRSLQKKCVIGKIATGETFITQKSSSKFMTVIKSFDVVDMEACAIAQVCNRNGCSYAFIKIVSDTIHHKDVNEKQ